MRLVFLSVLVLVFVSCDTPRYAYSPNAHNVPVLTKQGDSKIAAAYSANLDVQESNNQYKKNSSNGYDLQGAVAVTNHIGLQGSYYSRRERSYGGTDFDYDSSVVRYKRSLFEFGAGYFTPIDRKHRVIFQVFAGAGFGKMNFTDRGRNFNGNLYDRFYSSDIMKYYLEPAIIFKNKETFAASLSTRLSVIRFKNVKTDYNITEKQDLRLDSLNRYAIAFFEPAFVNSYGFNKLPGFRIEYQLGLSLALLREDFISYRPFNFSVGLLFDIPKMIKGPAAKNGN